MLADLRAVAQRDDEGLTSTEWGEALGWTKYATANALRALVKAGKMVPGRAKRTGMHGVEQPVPVYRLKG